MPTQFRVLTQDEMDELFRQDPRTASDGGFQNFIVRLQRQARRGTLEIRLDEDDLDRIRKYAADASHGGWQTRTLKIFGRLLDEGSGAADGPR